jgi:hypothetical protein
MEARRIASTLAALGLAGLAALFAACSGQPDSGSTPMPGNDSGSPAHDSGNPSSPDSGTPGTDPDSGQTPLPDSGGGVPDSGHGHDSGTTGHDAGHDAAGGDAGGGDGGKKAFGETCVLPSDCESNLCEPFQQGNEMLCTKACTVATQATDCPAPPSAGTCTPKGYCRFN